MSRISPQRLVELAFRFKANSEYILFQGQRLTRRQAFTHIKALAAGLQALGVVKGDRVATLLPACPEAVFAAFLPSVLGIVHVPLNPLLGEHELCHILADCGAKVVLTSQTWYGKEHAAIVARLQPNLPNLDHIIVCDAAQGQRRAWLSLEEVLSGGRRLRWARVSSGDRVLISYTSGTTGQPKGVTHTQQGYWGQLVSGADARLDLSSLRCLLLPFPPYHYAGLLGIVATLLAGGKVILMERFDPERLLVYIQEERVSQIAGSPTMYRWLLSTPGQEGYDLSSVQRLTFSTEPISVELAQALHERLGCSLENFYGTTESMLISWTSLDDGWQRAATTIGKPVPGAQVRIVDEDRRSLPAGQRGEIAVRTTQMMAGYHRDPELTAQVLDAGGWFYTGDIGYQGEDGYLRLVDRKKDIVIRGGQNIYPTEVEQYLERHALVRRAAVLGLPDEVAGETLWAALELQPGASLTVQEVLDFCRGQIAPYKIPAEICFVERLPTTASGKVQKFKLRELAARELNADDPA